METHGIHPGADRKELPNGARQITCSDCGHIYWIAITAVSSSCAACGNVEYGSESRELLALSEEIVARRILPRLEERENPLQAFSATLDGKEVEKIQIQYQVEWQLWAVLVTHFREPAYHMAYLATVLLENRLDLAADRYREHRSVMAVLDDSRWQAEVADLMLERIENLSVARMSLEARGETGLGIFGFFKMLPFESRLPKVLWIVLGFILAMRLFRVLPG